MTADELARGVDRLVDLIGVWTPSRWAASTPSGPATRAETVHALAQRLADLEASSTGRPDRRVPRLDNDLVLADQVRVTARDLLATEPPPEVLAEAIEAVSATRHALTS